MWNWLKSSRASRQTFTIFAKTSILSKNGTYTDQKTLKAKRNQFYRIGEHLLRYR